MLTEQEKEHIKQEEIFRYKIRQYLENSTQPKTFGQRVWSFLNSPVGIWFLSTVAFGLISYSYASWQKTDTQLKNNFLVESKLDIEIANRLNQFQQSLNSNTHSPSKRDIELARMGADFTGIKVYWAINRLNTTKPIFPEFENETFMSLLWELHHVVPDEEKSEIVTMIGAYKEFVAYTRSIDIHISNVHQIKAFLNKEYLEKAFNVRDWML